MLLSKTPANNYSPDDRPVSRSTSEIETQATGYNTYDGEFVSQMCRRAALYPQED
jgi:hypothetical protein